MTNLRPLLRSGQIATLSDLFTHIPKKQVQQETGITIARLNSIIEQPEKMRLEEYVLLRDWLGVSDGKMMKLLGFKLNNK